MELKKVRADIKQMINQLDAKQINMILLFKEIDGDLETTQGRLNKQFDRLEIIYKKIGKLR